MQTHLQTSQNQSSELKAGLEQGQALTPTTPSANLYKFTPLRISTMVATAQFNTSLNLTQLFEDIKTILIPLWWPGEGVLKFEHRDQVIGQSHRDALTKRKISNKCFFNQSTLVVRRKSPSMPGWKEVNLKLFANGSVQMTGIASEEFGVETLEWLIAEVKQLPRSPWGGEPSVVNFNKQLINSDFSVGTSLRRDKLHEIITRQYNIFSILESTIYQGVNTKYYYNETSDKTHPGQCTCKEFCQGQGTGIGEGQCKRITISFFQTGNIIITGARHMKQINEAYEFVKEFLVRHATDIIRPAPPPAPAPAAKTKTVAPKKTKTRVKDA
jgi:TATA-box binding protein (TBP) (component of TFIID and TFIIIB)